ncbi:ARABIDOPSIS THALIANA KUNITZ TRYPSIN INHIBITOR 5 [Hibiscus trionum]|uniref:ARABIDOPSIS THALIANA KUNITZ TRYPSIN INHIBITOR 5 n=1 Tax=Hibiscus trionum TaxID=183268 RepID=A0A9W7MTE0_HIBTR|nr:ARABIDOPSIS THALIANA KUNITZ TRYPSIN INHIBITOR 5 [Hibiscus trionum]
MKTTTASVFLLFIFSIIQSSFLFGVANAANDAVLDVDGDEVLTGLPYYVLPATWGAGGGGLAIGKKSDRKCPEIVVQRRSDDDFGNPVVFSNADSSDGVIRLSSDVEGEDKSSGKRLVELGGSEGEPGCDTVDTWFKLETTGFNDESYKFKYCPSICSSSITSCHDIGKVQDHHGHVRLALSDDGTGFPWPWIFIKAYGGNGRIRQVVRA